MNSFDERYYPLKRKFTARSKKFTRDRELAVQRIRTSGSELVISKIRFPAASPENIGKRLIFTSDWHWHNSDRNQRILQEFSRFTAEFRPDLLLLGGDICDDADTLTGLPELLAHLSSLAPEVLTVNGNWEAGKRWLKPDFFAGLYAENNIILLENSSFRIGSLRFTGLPDISSINFRYIQAPPAEAGITDILLTHSPDGVVASDKRDFLKNFALAFCGHTHGGQVRLPLFGAVYCPGFYAGKFDRGIFSRKGYDLKMIVSSGIGEHNGTFRFLCPPEAIALEFVP
ncbi:MAG: metallophosphoesterase [Lentisphaeria bacterium]|nr:metallophosphoesterase [Lentisphaeria bacterium]